MNAFSISMASLHQPAKRRRLECHRLFRRCNGQKSCARPRSEQNMPLSPENKQKLTTTLSRRFIFAHPSPLCKRNNHRLQPPTYQPPSNHIVTKTGGGGQLLTSCAKLSAAMPSITTLDNLWTGRPHTIAAALLESDGHRSIVDPGPGSTLETFHQQLQSHGLGLADLDAILLTHIHLDHAGATGALVRENPP